MKKTFLMFGALLALGTLHAAPLSAVEPTVRTVYVTAVDNKGVPVEGLTAADLGLKEGGKDREITSVEPARTKMRLALAIEETLTASTAARQGLADLAVKLAPHAEMSLVVLGLSHKVVVPYTSDAGAIVNAIRALPQVQQGVTNVGDGMAALAKEFEKDAVERPVMLVIALERQGSLAGGPEGVLGPLRNSRAQVHVVSVSGGGIGRVSADMMEDSGLTEVFSEGPRQTGGRQVRVNSMTAVPAALEQVATELSSQYAVTYTLPDGVKPSDRLAVSTKKRGVTLRAPTRLPSVK